MNWFDWLRRVTPAMKAKDELDELDREEFEIHKVLCHYKHRLAYVRSRRAHLSPPEAGEVVKSLHGQGGVEIMVGRRK